MSHKLPVQRMRAKGWGEKIPIKKPKESEVALFEKLVAMVQQAKRENLDIEAAFLEELIDACVLAASEVQIISEGNRAKPGSLYFPEEAAEKDLLFMDQVAEIVDDASSFVIPAPSTPRSSATKLEASSTIESIGSIGSKYQSYYFCALSKFSADRALF